MHSKGRYYYSTPKTEMIGDREMVTPRLLMNDGAAALMVTREDGTNSRIALIDCQTPFKRGEGWKTECAERDANLRLFAHAAQMYDYILNRANASAPGAMAIIRAIGNEK